MNGICEDGSTKDVLADSLANFLWVGKNVRLN